MIQIPRSLVRQLGAVFRRCLRKLPGLHRPMVVFQASDNGLDVRVPHPEVAMEYHQAGRFAPETLSVPLEELAKFEGKTQDVVTLANNPAGMVVVQWLDGKVPQMLEYEAGDLAKLPEFPVVPERLVVTSPGLLSALDHAAQTTASDGVRFAVQRIQLRGKSGEVVATDGHQLLIQGLFHFPWAENVLIPRVPVFGLKELTQARQVEIGRTEQFVTLRLGPWTFHLHVDADARYPEVEKVIPKKSAGGTCWRMDPKDADFLARTLPRLPGQEDENKPTTIDLNGQVCVRAKGFNQSRVTELILARSSFTGKPVSLCINRELLARILQLGFSEVQITSPSQPLLCEDATRKFVCMPLDKEGVILGTDEAIKILSADEAEMPQPAPPEKRKRALSVSTPTSNGHPSDGNDGRVSQPSPPLLETPTPERRIPAMPRHIPANNGHTNGVNAGNQSMPASEQQGTAISIGALISEAEAVKDLLRGAYDRSSRLLASLKRHRKQSKLVASTLASLRQLEQFDR